MLSTAAIASEASALQYCDATADLNAGDRDKLLRFAAVIKTELDQSGESLALMSRSGLDLSRFGVRYSHAGISLKASANAPWSVRQLYYACDEHKPRIFDQGMAGFTLGTSDPHIGYVSLIFLPPDAAQPLERVVLDNRIALTLLSPSYSANAYPFDLRYQNCNQWMMEMLAAAWDRSVNEAGDSEPSITRARSQRWMREQGYVPTLFDVGALMLLTAFVPWIHTDDHPSDVLERRTFQVSMPSAIEAFVREYVPGARRIEFCHSGRRVVIRHGWDSIADGCVPGPGDEVLELH